MSASICNLIRHLKSFRSAWLFILAACLPIFGQAQRLQDVRISLVLKHASLKEAMSRIETLTPFKFLARAQDIEGEQDISIDVKDEPMDKVLGQLFKGRNLQWSQVRSNIILKRPVDPPVQNPALPVAAKPREKYTISGTVRSGKTGETLISATLIIRSPGSSFSTGTTSNGYGFYSLSLPPGKYLMEVSMAGMRSQSVDILLEGNTILNIPMEEEAEDLQTFTIRATPGRRNLENPQMGMEHLSMAEIKDMPVLLGERDVLKTIQLLPGIKPAGDGNSGFYVRGGTADQNLILLDEATVYNPSHLFGFFSTFNSDAIKNIEVYKAGMPAQYGGRLSSVVDVRMNDGNDKDYSANGGIGLISSRLTVEGPIEKDKSSFLVSGRHLISNSVASSPTDRWVANTNIIKPELSDQVALGYYRNLHQDRYELTVETYYKTMQNQIDYRDGANVYTNKPIETQLLFGKGRAYGIEWQLKKKEGRLTGWVSYTLSKTERRIDGINNNQWYNARQDRTHDIAVVATYQFNKKWIFSADWVFYTGDAITFPSGKYTVEGIVYFYYTRRNGYRMPNYHRLDLGATCQLRKKKKFSSELNFSLYNAYGRENAYQISFRQSTNDPNRTEAVQTTLFRFVPSITYNFKF